MKSVKLLIDMARAKVQTDRELAEKIGISPTELCELKAGRRPLSPEVVAALCDVLQLSGEECRSWVAHAIIENPKNASRADILRRALFACWAFGAALAAPPKDASAMQIEKTPNHREIIIEDVKHLQVGDLLSIHCRAWRWFSATVRWIRRTSRALRAPCPGMSTSLPTPLRGRCASACLIP